MSERPLLVMGTVSSWGKLLIFQKQYTRANGESTQLGDQ